MGWHEEYPEWSTKVHALACRLATLDGKDPEADVFNEWGVCFTEADTYLVEAVEVYGGPEQLAAERRARALAMVNWRERRIARLKADRA